MDEQSLIHAFGLSLYRVFYTHGLTGMDEEGTFYYPSTHWVKVFAQ
jgi:hypothetical protein